MSDVEQVRLPPGESLRRHVLDPVATAETVLNRGHEEVDAERRAFERFRERVAVAKTGSDASGVPTTRKPLGTDRPRTAERIRSAYRDTVMDIGHYDDVYGESPVEHVAAELSTDLAASLRRDALLAVLDELNGTRVPASVGVDFTDALDEIACHRQETFAGRTASPRTDGHDLCNYLYADCAWRYPVLTAVTRLRGAVNGVGT